MSRGQWNLIGDFFGPFLFYSFFTMLFVMLASVPGCGFDKVEAAGIEQQVFGAFVVKADHDLLAVMQHRMTFNGETAAIAGWLTELSYTESDVLANAITNELNAVAGEQMCGELKARRNRDRYYKEAFGKCEGGVEITSTMTLPRNSPGDGVIRVELNERIT